MPKVEKVEIFFTSKHLEAVFIITGTVFKYINIRTEYAIRINTYMH